jgi:septal ring factor EnvC (AmiA/AmiB activator)
MRTLKGLIFSLVISIAVSNIAFADGNAFTPLDFDKQTTPTKVETNATEAIGNENIQNAILQLDNAQVGIRNDLINYKSKYADVDAQYKLIKNERTVLKKQIKAIEKRIKNIERSKEKLRKSML